jgi:hypothetical protein
LYHNYYVLTTKTFYLAIRCAESGSCGIYPKYLGWVVFPENPRVNVREYFETLLVIQELIAYSDYVSGDAVCHWRSKSKFEVYGLGFMTMTGTIAIRYTRGRHAPTLDELTGIA